MNRTAIIIAAALSMLTFSSCVKSKLEQTYNNQESKIDSYITNKGEE